MKNDGSWYYAFAKHDSSYKTLARWADRNYINCLSGFQKEALDLENVIGYSDKFILDDRGNCYFFRPTYRDKNIYKVTNIEEIYNLYQGVVGISSERKGSYIGWNGITHPDRDGIIVKLDLAPGRKIDKVAGNKDLVCWLNDDNTIGGMGLSKYCQLVVNSYDKSWDYYKMLHKQDLYNMPVRLDKPYDEVDLLPPMEIVCDDVRNKRYEEDENDKLMEDIYNTYKRRYRQCCNIIRYKGQYENILF